MKDEFVAVFDCDGVITDGTFWQSKEGKQLKRYGADDWDAIDLLKQHMSIQFITADKTGWDMVHSRVVTDKKYLLELVSNKPKERWDWIRNQFPDKKIIYIGDGIFDYFPLMRSDYGITTYKALPHVTSRADYVSQRKGADRFVADACLHILKKLGHSSYYVGLSKSDFNYYQRLASPTIKKEDCFK